MIDAISEDAAADEEAKKLELLRKQAEEDAIKQAAEEAKKQAEEEEAKRLAEEEEAIRLEEERKKREADSDASATAVLYPKP